MLEAECAVWCVLFAAARGTDLLTELAAAMEQLGNDILEAAPAWLCVEGQPGDWILSVYSMSLILDYIVKDKSSQPRLKPLHLALQPASLRMEDCMLTFDVSVTRFPQKTSLSWRPIKVPLHLSP